MHAIQIPDGLFEQASLAAKLHQLTVEEFIVRAVQVQVEENESDFDDFFNAERVREIREAQAEARLGRNLSVDQVAAHFETRRKAWIASQTS